MLNIINKITIILISLFYFISLAKAVDIIDNENNSLSVRSEAFKKKIMKYDYKEIERSFMIKSNVKFKSKINDSTRMVNRVSNNFYFNDSNRKKIILSRINIAFIKIINDKYGSFGFGRNNGVIKDALNYTANAVPQFNNTFNKFNNFMVNKSDNLFFYKNKNLFNFINGLKIKLQFQGKNETIKAGNFKLIKSGNGYGLGISSSYFFKDFSVIGAYFKSKRTDDQMLIDINKVNKYASSYAAACKYDTETLYLSTLYSVNYNITPYGNINNSYIRKLFEEKSTLRKYYYCGFAPKVSTIEFVSKLKLPCGVQPHVAYFRSFAKSIKYNIDQYLTNFISFGSSYVFNKNATLFVDFKINLLKANEFVIESGIDLDDAASIGISYKF